VLVIDDVRTDPRFDDNDFLREMDIDWYAGATVDVEDRPIATLCLEDSEQQEFSGREQRILRLLADHVARLFELKHQTEATKQML